MSVIFIGVSAVVLTLVTAGVYYYSDGGPPADTSKLAPFFNRMYEVDIRCEEFDSFLQKLGMKNETRRHEVAEGKRLFMLTGDTHGRMWWMTVGPKPQETWYIKMKKIYSWKGPNNVKMNSFFALDSNKLLEIQTWKQNDGKMARMTIVRHFTDDNLLISMSQDNVKTESTFKFKAMYDPQTATAD